MSPCSQSLCMCANGAALGGETYYCKIVRISQYLVNLLLPNLLQKLHGQEQDVNWRVPERQNDRKAKQQKDEKTERQKDRNLKRRKDKKMKRHKD